MITVPLALRDSAAQAFCPAGIAWCAGLPGVAPALPRSAARPRGQVARQLGPESGNLLIHTALHYENVLASLRRENVLASLTAPPEPTVERAEWLAIDPKPMAGDPAFGVLPMLWNRLDELDGADPGAALRRRMQMAAEFAGLDVEQVRGWSVARAVETIIWNTEIGLVQEAHRPAWVAETLSAR